MKKTISLLIIAASLFQTGCVGKKPAVMSLDEVKFDEKYKYTVRLKNGKSSQKVPGSQIKHENENVILHSSPNDVVFPDSDIRMIKGDTIERNGSYMFQGALIGTATLATVGGLVGLLIVQDLRGPCTTGNCDSHIGSNLFGILLFGSIGAAVGAGAGALVGLTIPKRDKVEITPIVSTSKTLGTTAGGSMQFRF